ncbi:MAG: GNAT family N-acetyltransferase [Candidatus Izemoplasmataceae bacterium]
MKIKKIAFDHHSELMIKYKQSLYGIIDDFVEDLILSAEHYMMFEDDEFIGQIGVLDNAVTFFYVLDDFKYKQTDYFIKFVKAKKIEYAYVSTADLDFFHTATQFQEDVTMQAKFFLKTNAMPTAFDFDYIDFARLHDKEEIDMLTEGEFDDLHERIQAGQVYVFKEEGELVGVGVISDSKMFTSQVNLGVFTKKKHQRRGIASTLLEFMSEKMLKDHKKVVAGCYYYNEASSKMLMHSGFRLMNILEKIKLK